MNFQLSSLGQDLSMVALELLQLRLDLAVVDREHRDLTFALLPLVFGTLA